MNCFNPYSPGFSIYLIQDLEEMVLGADASILIHLDFLSISWEKVTLEELVSKLQSLFTWILDRKSVV